VTDYPDDIFTERDDVDVDTLANLGPLAPMAGVWEGTKGLDVNPYIDAPRRQVFIERIELQPVDRQSNGPQVLYGLRYHTHIVKPGEVETYHDQVGYRLWEPATRTIILTLTIPRAQAVMAIGHAEPDARSFEVTAVTINDDGTWSYFEDTVPRVRGEAEPFHHTDRNTFTRIEAPTPNPLAREAQAA